MLTIQKIYNKQINDFQSSESGATFSLIAAIYFVALIVITFIVNLFSIDTTTNTYHILSSAVLYGGLILLSITVMLNKGSASKNLVKKLNVKYLVISLLLMASMFMSVGKVNTLFSNWLIKIGLQQSAQYNITTNFEYVLAIFMFALMPALVEEFLFRGVILFGLNSKSVVCAIFTAILFTIFHANFYQVLYQFAFGFAFSLIAIKTGSILYGIIMHFVSNTFLLTMQYFFSEINYFSSLAITIVASVVFVALITYLLVFDKVKMSNQNKPFIKEFIIKGVFGVSFFALMYVIQVIGLIG